MTVMLSYNCQLLHDLVYTLRHYPVSNLKGLRVTKKLYTTIWRVTTPPMYIPYFAARNSTLVWHPDRVSNVSSLLFPLRLVLTSRKNILLCGTFPNKKKDKFYKNWSFAVRFFNQPATYSREQGSL